MRIRDDDVLLPSNSIKDVVGRLQRVHRNILEFGADHVVAILTGSIQQWPEGINFIRAEMLAGRMELQFHGVAHIDYAKVTYNQIREDLQSGQLFFQKNFGVKFTKFYTPWGANASHIREACKAEGVEMVDCSYIVEAGHITEHKDKDFSDRELLIHWWRSKDLQELRAIFEWDPEYLAR